MSLIENIQQAKAPLSGGQEHRWGPGMVSALVSAEPILSLCCETLL